MAALKETHRKEMAAMELEHLRQSGAVVPWAELPVALLAKVLEAAGWLEGGLGFSQNSATVRLVCAGWKAVHDALVTRLVLRPQTTDEAMGMLARRFPAVVSLEIKREPYQLSVLTDEGLRSVSSLRALTYLDLGNLDLGLCSKVTDEGIRAVSSCTALKSLIICSCIVTDEGIRAVVSSCTALKSLNLTCCPNVTDEGIRAVSSCTGLTSLNLCGCRKVTADGLRVSNLPALTVLDLSRCVLVTDEALRAVISCTTLTSLNLTGCEKVTDAGVRALSILPALTFLNLEECPKVTAAGVQALRSTTAAPSLRIRHACRGVYSFFY
jgi:hypothetical protein